MFSQTNSLQNGFVMSAKRFCNTCKTVLQSLQNRLAGFLFLKTLLLIMAVILFFQN